MMYKQEKQLSHRRGLSETQDAVSKSQIPSLNVKRAQEYAARRMVVSQDSRRRPKITNNLANKPGEQNKSKKSSRCASARKDYSGYNNAGFQKDQLESSFRRHDTQKVVLAKDVVTLKNNLEQPARQRPQTQHHGAYRVRTVINPLARPIYRDQKLHSSYKKPKGHSIEEYIEKQPEPWKQPLREIMSLGSQVSQLVQDSKKSKCTFQKMKMMVKKQSEQTSLSKREDPTRTSQGLSRIKNSGDESDSDVFSNQDKTEYPFTNETQQLSELQLKLKKECKGEFGIVNPVRAINFLNVLQKEEDPDAYQPEIVLQQRIKKLNQERQNIMSVGFRPMEDSFFDFDDIAEQSGRNQGTNFGEYRDDEDFNKGEVVKQIIQKQIKRKKENKPNRGLSSSKRQENQTHNRSNLNFEVKKLKILPLKSTQNQETKRRSRMNDVVEDLFSYHQKTAQDGPSKVAEPIQQMPKRKPGTVVKEKQRHYIQRNIENVNVPLILRRMRGIPQDISQQPLKDMRILNSTENPDFKADIKFKSPNIEMISSVKRPSTTSNYKQINRSGGKSKDFYVRRGANLVNQYSDDACQYSFQNVNKQIERMKRFYQGQSNYGKGPASLDNSREQSNPRNGLVGSFYGQNQPGTQSMCHGNLLV